MSLKVSSVVGEAEPTGTVAFYVDFDPNQRLDAPIVKVGNRYVVQVTTSALLSGSRIILATFPGGLNDTGSSATTEVTVAGPTVSLVAFPQSPTVGQPVGLSAAVGLSGAAGTVALLQDARARDLVGMLARLEATIGQANRGQPSGMEQVGTAPPETTS